MHKNRALLPIAAAGETIDSRLILIVTGRILKLDDGLRIVEILQSSRTGTWVEDDRRGCGLDGIVREG